MNKSILKERTKKFALDCIHLTHNVPDNYLGKHIKNQLIRCSTSVAANYRATCLAQSRAAFIAKLSIVIEEADESEFWLELLHENNILRNEKVDKIKDEAHQLASIFIVTRKNMQSKPKS